jgi:hypothetical protein
MTKGRSSTKVDLLHRDEGPPSIGNKKIKIEDIAWSKNKGPCFVGWSLRFFALEREEVVEERPFQGREK